MAGKGPTILVIAADRDERALIAATLREAGFAAVEAADAARAEAPPVEPFAAAVLALPDDGAVGGLRSAEDLDPGLPAVLIGGPAARPILQDAGATLLERPLDPRRLLGCVVELVLPEEGPPGQGSRLRHTAELGIAAARLACLCNRRAVAAAAGAGRLAQDLTRQIGEMRTTCGGLAAAAMGGLAAEGCAG